MGRTIRRSIPLALSRSRLCHFLLFCGFILQLSAAGSEHPTVVHKDVANPIRFLNWTPPREASASAFVHVSVIPMNQAGTLQDCTVVIRAGHIVAIGPTKNTPTPTGAMVIDGKGKYLIPGLIDMRVHLYSPGEMLLYLANGVTTVRNLNGRPQHLLWRDKINARKMLGPTILTAGPIIETAETAIEGKRIVMEQSRAGYDAVEVGANVSAEAFNAIAATARALGVLLFGAVNTKVGLKGTVSAPQFFSVEQVEQYATVVFKANSETPEGAISEAAAELRNARVWFAPALVSSGKVNQKGEDVAQLPCPPETRYLPRWAQREWCPPQDSRQEELGTREAALFHRKLSFENKITSLMHRDGVPMILGTDAMVGATMPGFSVHQELENFLDAGFTPFEALQTATRNASAWFVHPEGGGVFGTVALGERADLVLLDADPLAEMGNASKIQGVMVQGRWLPEAELQRMLGALPLAYSAEDRFLTSAVQSRPETASRYLRENDPFHKVTNQVMLELVISKGVEALQSVYSRLQEVDSTSIILEEMTVNDLGFQLLELNRNSDAVAVFRFNIHAHPNSARADDSLAQAYLKSGNQPKAVQYFREALRVDSTFGHAREALEQLGNSDDHK